MNLDLFILLFVGFVKGLDEMNFKTAFFMCLLSVISVAMDVTDAHDPLVINDQDSLNQVVLEEFKEIVREYNERLESARLATNKDALLKILSRGSWYAADYYKLLSSELLANSEAAKKRLDYFKKRAYFVVGFVEKESNLELRSKDGDSGDLYRYGLKGRNASSVINSIGKNGVILIDCAIAYQLAFYRAMLKFWGEERFNTIIFNRPGLDLFSDNLNNTFLKYFVSIIATDKLEIGMIYYIHGHPLYLYRNFFQEGQGFNVMVSDYHGDEPRFIGYGMPADIINASQIQEMLINAFHQESLNEKLLATSTKTWQNRAVRRFNQAFASSLIEETINSVDDREVLDRAIDRLVGQFSEEALKTSKSQLATLFNRDKPRVTILNFQRLLLGK